MSTATSLPDRRLRSCSPGLDGRLPVPGTGRYEWGPEKRTDLPSEYNPERGFIATANNERSRADFAPPYAYVAADRRYRRHERIVEMLTSGKSFTIDDMVRMLRDSYNAEAAERQKHFRGWTSNDPQVEKARALVARLGRRDEPREHGRRNLHGVAATYRHGSAGQRIAQCRRDGTAGRGRGPDQVAGLRLGSVAVGPDQPQRVPAPGRRRVRPAAHRTSWRRGHSERDRRCLPFRHELRGPGRVEGNDRTWQLRAAGQPVLCATFTSCWGRNEFFPLLFTRPAVEANTRHRLTLAPRGE